MRGYATLETQDDPGDDILVSRVAGGDAAAFRALAGRHAGVMFSIAYRFFRERGIAEDVVQDTLLKLWLCAGDWSPHGGASVRTWLCRIASNLCIDRQRRGARERSGIISDDIPDAAPGPEADAAAQETGRYVGLALLQLPDRQRLALTLFHYEGLSVQEIGAVLEITPKAAEGLLTRGRAAMRQELLAYKKQTEERTP